MSLADSREQRRRWAAKAQRAVNTIEDLRRELAIAIQQQPPAHVALKLSTIDTHLAVAQNELAEAIARMNLIQ